MRQCPRCKGLAGPQAKICNGCGDFLYGNYIPMFLLIVLVLPMIGFGILVSSQPGFSAHPRRVALAQLGLGPDEDAINVAVIANAKQKGVVKRQRDLFAFDVNEAAWKKQPDAERDQLKEAFVQRVYGRELHGGDVVKVYAGSSGRIVTAIKAPDVADMRS